ncbi:DUF5067 domain-containing protein [Enterococcus sp. LJL99]
MKWKKVRIVQIVFLTVIVSACSKNSTEKTIFEANNSEYSFQFFKGWSQLDESENTINEEAVFQAEDDSSKAVMFIRAQQSKQLSEKELEKKIDNQLTPIYQLDVAEKKSFKTANYEGISYKIPSVYEQKAVWLYMYFISTETNIINFQYYFPKNNSVAKLEETALESVESLKLEKKGTVTEESTRQEMKGVQQVEQDNVYLQVTGNKVEESTLILRYVVTNQSDHAVVPLAFWQELVTTTSGQNTLEMDGSNQEDTELNYLITKSQQKIEPGNSVECAIVYKLPNEKEAIKVQLGNQKDPLTMTIER